MLCNYYLVATYTLLMNNPTITDNYQCDLLGSMQMKKIEKMLNDGMQSKRKNIFLWNIEAFFK